MTRASKSSRPATWAILLLAISVAGCRGGDRSGAQQDGSGSQGEDDDGAGESGDDGPGGDPEAYFDISMRILTAPQYRRAVTDLLGAAAAAELEPPPDIAVLGFDAVGSAQFAMTSDAVRAYEGSARAAAAVAIADAQWFDEWVGCDASSSADEDCLRDFVVSFGRRAWRRSLVDDEIATWVAIGTAGSEATGRADGGIEAIVSGLLQSPHFLYLVEIGVPDPDDPSRLRLDGYEVATRLAFFLTGTAPDGALLDAAEVGELDSADGIRTHAAELLARPGAREAVREFFDELFRLRDLPAVAKDSVQFPEFSAELAAAMREETLLLFDDAAFSGVDFRGVFAAEYTFVDDELAALYGLPAPGGDELVRVELPADGPRAGVLGQASFLALMSHPNSTSPTLRGKFVRERVLCETVAKPPPDVDTSFPDIDPDNPTTTKDRLLEHRENPTCAGCHTLMDDVGLGLEQFDAIGRFRETENGLTIDASSNFDGQAFTGLRELGVLLQDDPRTASCLARNFVRVATGHVESPDQVPLLLALDDAFAEVNYDVVELLVAIATSDAFRYAEPPGDDP